MAAARDPIDIKQQFAKFSFTSSTITENIVADNEKNITEEFVKLSLAEAPVNFDAKSDTEIGDFDTDLTTGWEIVPDVTVFSQIFRDRLPAHAIANLRHKILDSTIDSCTFVITLDEDQSPMGFPSHLLARIEKPRRNSPLFGAAAFQKLAHRRLPHLVPKVWGFGDTQTSGGIKLHYFLSQYYHDVVTVEAVWEDFNHPVREALMKEVVMAMTYLQDLRLTTLSGEDWAILAEMSLADDPVEDTLPVLGGPQVGWFKDMKSFLMKRLAPGKAKYDLSAKKDGTISLKTDFPKNDMPNPQNIIFTPENLALLEDASVLCHNDIEPCNILIRLTMTEFGPGFQLVAITNWDNAGFFPFAYETALKDTCLGAQNKCGSWYETFKEFSSCLLEDHSDLPDLGSQEKLIRAVILADRGQKRSQGFHVGNRVQEKWLEREQLQRADTARVGFVRAKKGPQVGPFTKADDELLEEEALIELGYI